MNWHKMTPFPTQYCLATPDQIQKWAKKNKVAIGKFNEEHLGGVFAAGSYIFVVVSPKQEHWAVVDTIVHESVHVFQEAMKYVLEDTIGNETEAYGIASIAINLMKDFHAIHGQP